MTSWIRQSVLVRHLAYYMSYSALVWISHLFIISVIAFFHFLLDHNLKIIEEWIYDQGWFVVILSKSVALYFILKVINLKSDRKFPLRFYLNSNKMTPSREILIVVIFLLFFVVWLGRPQMPMDIDFNIYRAILSFIGNMVFYFSDFLIISLLLYYDPSEKWTAILEMFFFPLIFLLWQKGIFLYEQGIGFWVYFHLYFCLFLGIFISKSWTLPILYLVFFAAPISALMGLDPIWKSDFSLMKLSFEVKPVYLVALIFLNMGYLNYKKKKLLLEGKE